MILLTVLLKRFFESRKMNWIIILCLVTFTISYTFGRPSESSQSDEREIEENEYDAGGNGDTNDESRNADVNENEPSPTKQDGNTRVEVDGGERRRSAMDMSGNTFLQRLAEERSARASPDDNLSEKQQYGSRDILNERIDDAMDTPQVASQTLSKRGMLNKYLNKLSNGVKDPNLNHNLNKNTLTNMRDDYSLRDFHNKRSDEQRRYAKSSGSSIDNEHDSRLNQNYNKNKMETDTFKCGETKSLSNDFDQLSHDLKGSSVNPQIGIVGNRLNNDQTRYSRDRRNIEEQTIEGRESNTLTLRNEEDEKIKSEDEESTIRKHIKRLSSDELNDLLKSLSDNKRDLLKKIIESDNNNAGSLNKRDITKKAGAVEENNVIENIQLDSSKVQSEAAGDINSESVVTQKASDEKENNTQEIQSDAASLSTTKNLETTSIPPASDNGKTTISSDVDTFTVNDKLSNLMKKKRDIDNGNLDSGELSPDMGSDTNLFQKDNQDYFYSQGEDLSNLMEFESQLHNEYNKKREANYDNNDQIADSLISLEESFPNYNSYEDTALNMAPLVRVKRRNTNLMKKRETALIPDSKVSYFPYRAENDDEDNDEGNEFDDDGFYDRTSNLAKSIAEQHSKGDEINMKYSNLKNTMQETEPSSINNPFNPSRDGTMMSLGSDTDNILSGIEGVDDNLMYSSGSRSRRSSKNDLESNVPTASSLDKVEDKRLQSLDSRINYPIYQERDTFGPSQPNYAESLGRYKRIRKDHNGDNVE